MNESLGTLIYEVKEKFNSSHFAPFMSSFWELGACCIPSCS